jgi:hypothetical protein
VRKRHAPWAILGILFVSYGIWRWAGLVIAALCLLTGYLASIRLHPRTACGKCKGSGRHYGWIYSWVFRFCHKCLGSGRKVRWGSAQWGTSRVRSEAQAVRQAVQTAQRGRWVE